MKCQILLYKYDPDLSGFNQLIIKNKIMSEKLTQLYLPKGEWFDSISKAFSRANLEISAPPRCYEYKFTSSKLPIIFQAIRSKEVCLDVNDPETSVNGGFTGSDIVIEQYSTALWTFPLYNFESEKDNFPKPKIILGSTPNFRANTKDQKIQDLNSKTIYTSYPTITKRFFEENNTQVNIIERQGTIEGRWRTNFNNWAIVDIVNSGETLKANQIEIMEEILPAKIVYVENSNITNQDKLRVNDLQELLYKAKI